MRKILLLFLVLCVNAGWLLAQPAEDKAQLEKERQEIQKEIKEIQGLYDKVKGQKKQIVGQYNLLDRKIKLQNRYIANINKELRLIDDDIYMSNVEIFRMSRRLDTLKNQYARSIVYAYKNRSTYDFLNFIFSASNFNDAIKRVAYLKSYRSYREQQVNTIKETQVKIARRKEDQIGKKKQKDEALKNQTEQVKVLDVQKKEKDKILADLKSKEKDLEKQLAAKKKRDLNLKNAIAAIVRREIEAAKKKAEAEAKANAPKNPVTTIPEVAITSPVIKRETSPKSYLDLNIKDVALNTSIEQNRGKLPWPVDNGFVAVHFGKNEYPIPGSKPVIIDNPGITISTASAGIPVKVVFEGEVAGIHNMGDVIMVVIRHGKYFTTYSNLSSVNVAKGAIVKTGQIIGKVGTDDDDGSGGKLEFLFMIETKNINPESWLRK
jgi:septal ring factor EnvC (AmiA/AmiB activator)